MLHRRNFATKIDPSINIIPIFQFMNNKINPPIIKNPQIVFKRMFGPAGIICNIQDIKKRTIDTLQLKNIKITHNTINMDLTTFIIFILFIALLLFK